MCNNVRSYESDYKMQVKNKLLNIEMKKNVFVWVFIFCCGIFIFRNTYELLFKDVTTYKIHQSFIFGSDNYKSVDLKVIVNTRKYNAEELFETIRNEYIDVNGEPNMLCIELFSSQYAFEHAEGSEERTYKVNY